MDKVIRKFRLDTPEAKARCLQYLRDEVRPSTYKGDVVVSVYEHIAMVGNNDKAGYFIMLGEHAANYLAVLERISNHTGYELEELCKLLHESSDGYLYDHPPTKNTLHEEIKEKLNAGESTAAMERKSYKQLKQRADRFVDEKVQFLEHWAMENFGV